jgi:uncharacterized membrane protein YfcA
MVSITSGLTGLIISCVGIVVGNASGAGAGGFVVPCLFIFFNYSIAQSVALWNAVTLIVSTWRLTNAIRSKEKHPEGNKSIIDFNSVLIFLPLLFIGIECGFITMSILPEGVKLVIFSLMLLSLTGFTFRKAYARKRMEDSASKPLITSVSTEINRIVSNYDPELYCPVKKLALNALAFIMLTSTHLLLGSPRTASIIGIKLCSFEYWCGLLIYFLSLLLLLYYSYRLIKRERAENIQKGIMPFPSEFEWTSNLIFNIAALSILSGFFSSSYGVGGAIILNMILIYKGVNPEVVTSTTMLSLVSICLSTTTVYSISGILPLDVYSISLLILGLPLTIISYRYLKKILSKHASVVLFVLAYALGVSAILVALFGFYKAYRIDHNTRIWSFDTACHS